MRGMPFRHPPHFFYAHIQIYYIDLQTILINGNQNYDED